MAFIRKDARSKTHNKRVRNTATPLVREAVNALKEKYGGFFNNAQHVEEMDLILDNRKERMNPNPIF